MQPLVTATAMREIDALAVKRFHIPEMILMEHAALAVASSLATRFGRALAKSRGAVFAGPGNNGADAIAAARMLWINGHRQVVIVIPTSAKPSPLFGVQITMAKQLGIPIVDRIDSSALASVDWILDGIFGVGLTRAPEGIFLDWIREINEWAGRKHILAVDVPSGLDATHGCVLGTAVRASRTVTFGFAKTGLVTGEALDYVGGLTVAPIQIPRELAAEKTAAYLLESPDIRTWLPQRERDSHKGSFGKVSVLAGGPTMLGAAALSARGALRVGAGWTEIRISESLPGREEGKNAIPDEVILNEAVNDLPEGNVLAIGPGLGISDESRKLLAAALAASNPLVIDADGLNILAESKPADFNKSRSGNATILTPHPKEAARLLKVSVEEIQADRYGAAQQLADRYKAVVILKGAGTLIAEAGKPIAVIPTGDSGLAKAGTGDVLTGICAGLLAQGLGTFEAAAVASFLHGKGSEILTQRAGHSRSTFASEVADVLTQAIGDL